MRSLEKKDLIFQAAVNVIAEQGLDHFSMNRVCQEANISKGGFVYHFPSKEDLIRELNDYIIRVTRDTIAEEQQKGKSYTRSYIDACLRHYERNEMKAYSALLHYYSTEELQSAWGIFYTDIQRHLFRENSSSMARLVVLATDGLWLPGANYSINQLKETFDFLQQEYDQ